MAGPAEIINWKFSEYKYRRSPCLHFFDIIAGSGELKSVNSGGLQ
jgi:hypothetical protein